MIRDMGISTITICGLLTGCLSSSVLIANEFERQTVLAVLCKPIARIHYILGKYLGIILATTVLILSQGLVLEIALIINKYSKISSGLSDVSGLIDYVCLLGIYFSLLQVLILTAVSLILSLYLNTAANLTICLLAFILCHAFSYILPFYSHGYIIVSIVTNMLRIVSKLSKSIFDVYKRNSCRPDIILAERHYTTIYSMQHFLYCYILYSYYMVGGYSL